MTPDIQLDALAVAERLAAKWKRIAMQLVEENAMLEAYVAQLTKDSAGSSDPDAWGHTDPTN